MDDDSITAFLESISTLRVVFLKEAAAVQGLYKRPHHKHHVFKDNSGLIIERSEISMAGLPQALNVNRFNLIKAHRRPLYDKSYVERAIFRWEREVPGEIMKANRPGFGIENMFRQFCTEGPYTVKVYRSTKLNSFGLYCT